MKYLYTTAIVLLTSLQVHASMGYDTFLQQADSYLRMWVQEGKVDYQGIQNDFEPIDKLYQAIGVMSLQDLNEEEVKAFYINAYNLIILHQIAQYYPISSPLDQEGFFDKIRHRVAGEEMTLNHLEIMKIMIAYRDPRIHFALSNGAVSCPALASYAFQPQDLDQQLEDKTRELLNNDTFIQIEHKSKQIMISRIFAWYKNDFTFEAQNIRSFINQYREDALPTDYQLNYYEYYWVLNTNEVVGR